MQPRYPFVCAIALLLHGCGGCSDPECHVGADCGDASRCTEALKCEPDPAFATCATDVDCADDRRCDLPSKQCVRLTGGACRIATTCPAEAPRCRVTAGAIGSCVECAGGDDCPSGICGTDGTCVGVGPDVLPERVTFRTATQSFNFEWYVALKDGAIWVKPNLESSSQPPGEWRMLGATGLPAGSNVTRFAAPDRIVSISADGTHLHALSSAGVFYRGMDFRKADLSGFSWSDWWGWPAASGTGMVEEYSSERGWSVSDSHPFEVAHYEDRNDIEHSVGLGVAHLYRLDPDGHTLRWNDWWLANDWSRRICGPARGTFEAVAMSASASTLFLVGARGELFTRLYDFDTSGENDLLTYSYLITGSSGTTRAVPAEDWRRQPDITTGRITRRITIFQTGKGNAARMLRVEGSKDGETGFYFKPIFADAWSFQKTGLPLRGAPLGTPAAAITPEDREVTATLSRGTDAVTLRLVDFNVFCSPARARLIWDGVPATVDGAPFELPFHHVHRMIETIRPKDYVDSGTPALIRAGLLVPSELSKVEPVAARQALQKVLGTRKVVNFSGTATRTSVDLAELSWTSNFQVPLDEKCAPWDVMTLKGP